ncbi:type VI secretion system membrane subunit TssM [Rhizobium sp. P32RR-XVIII]|uniref:type VI secretion system membrane subunit TssM n=1 Tax=Rhizobium sp. P32RR-XVIII TaxID=2726738 RepID=UPI001456747B|nr:type VI secretion system membrane subunit TssM [Rhizobium sp. P32RR-XVIII]NLS07983.1 type VI secretion system membrane subunit TssM [Rhizobium sp. P32RR-XVIII]
MENLQYLAAYFVNRWTYSFAGVGMASMLVWYLAPLMPGFDGYLARTLLVLAMVVIWAGVNGSISWVRRRRENKLAAGLTEESASDERDVRAATAEEVARLRERVRIVLRRLRKGRRKGYLYEQPWYVLIGPPGSGKTTALLNAGLKFPMGQLDGEDAAVGGVGGTRLCDWWFADEAVLIDTAGRYTTQDSDAPVDRAGWEGFLDLLRRTRKRQPLNGAIVVVSLTDIAAADPATRAAHARTVRRRVTELSDRLRLRVPVYMVVSKADQLVGFNEYFDDLDAEGRGQVWGMTFPLAKGAETFTDEFRLLLDRLDERMFERLQAERAPDRRALLGGFPLQLASLQQPLADFLAQAFGGTRLDPAPFLRGVYITSATQEGTPIDRLTGMLSRSFGIDQKRAPSLRPVAGRSYFLERMLGEVILGESLLVSTNSKRIRHWRLLRIASLSAIAAVTLAISLGLWRVEASNRLAVERADEAIAGYHQQLAGADLDPVSNDDLTHIVPLLDAAQVLPREPENWLTGVFGLSQSEKLEAVERLIYHDSLERILLPRLIWRLEQQMRSQMDKPDFVFEATRVYLMLGGAGPLDPALVRDWMALDWSARFPGVLNAQLREHLLAHLNALLSDPLPPVTLDGALVQTARASFSRVSLAARVYGRIRPAASAKSVPDWTPSAELGSAGSSLFTRVSGKSLAEGIPGFFTVAGFQKVLLPNLLGATQAAANESWILGQTQKTPSDRTESETLEREVVALYSADFLKQWDDMLNDLALAPFEDRPAAIQGLYVLSAPQSPMRDLLKSIALELTFMPTGQPTGDGTPAPAGDPSVAAAATAQQKSLAAAIGGAATPDAASMPAIVDLDQHYRPLRDFVGDGQAEPITGVFRLINMLQQELAQLGPDASNVPATLQGSGDPVQLLLAESQRQPPPLARWLQQIADSGRSMITGSVQHAAAAAFSAADGPSKLCGTVVTRQFPFSSSNEDAPLDDFARLFGPAGVLDTYFQRQIKPFVNMKGAAWQLQPLGGVAPPVSQATLALFQRAAAIRDAFFPAGGEPRIRFDITPQPPHDGDEPATLTLGGRTINTSDGAAGQASLTWPGADGLNPARVTFGQAGDVVAVDAGGSIGASGPWALFRLLRQARISPSGRPQEFTVTFRSGTHEARFTLRAGSSRNPFSRNLLRDFRCPVLQ